VTTATGNSLGFMPPMLATLTDDPFSHPDWVFEDKLDGVRCIAVIQDGRAILWSRNEKRMNASYPEVVTALEKAADHDMVVDGEIVAFDGKLTSFSALQPRIHLRDEQRARETGIKVYFYAFDLLWLAGHNLTESPLLTRKKLLRRALHFGDRVRFSTHRKAGGRRFYLEACAEGREGLIAKRADSTYVHERSRDWLKFKCTRGQEFVIGGYTEPGGSRKGFGSLLLGYYSRGKLIYAGKVGTGFSAELLGDLSTKLRRLERKSCPFNEPPHEPRAHWVRPKLVAEVVFMEWTPDGRLRHPRFTGLRTDKPARAITREELK
jgi:bifunctional non-homologous end joining protein LigD